MKIMKRLGKKGFTLVEIMIVVAIIGLLAVIAIPNFVRARQTAQKNACINNLRIIDGAKEQYALENNLATSDTIPAGGLIPYIKGAATSGMPTCPAGGATPPAYTINVVGTDPVCPVDAATHKLP